LLASFYNCYFTKKDIISIITDLIEKLFACLKTANNQCPKYVILNFIPRIWNQSANQKGFYMQTLPRWLAILFITFCFWCTNAWAYYTSAEVTALPSKAANYRLAYGDEPQQYGDLRLPAGNGPFPVAIILHGGCWIKAIANSENAAPLADALRDLGIATWNVEYRGIDETGGGWPGTFKDAALATDYLKKIAGKYHLDLHHVIVIGHSAGGHLGFWLAARHKLPSNSELYTKNPLKLSGVIGLGAIVDLQAYNNQTTNACGANTIPQLLGDQPDALNKRYMEASPAALLPLGVTQILIYGTDDTIVPAHFGKEYVANADKKGESVKLIIVDKAAHHEYMVPYSTAWPAVKEAVFSLIK
jgi:acetyl esterase/lipase